ncbi:MAG: hypothetical protein ALECFALPRED_007958 [Alectoria fallacina]|uniref:Uncharacterized protein n=1 Tax=Alectoria fallacina TaxID=1903189 RepID=A0A8H3J1P5_9LECA|nr:MAG: hypothetical protein ALECFALPRED_007958 [Alectoria fallacina]
MLLKGFCAFFSSSSRRPDGVKAKDEEHQPIEPHSYEYPIFPPPPPQEILTRRSQYIAKIRARKYLVPEGELIDTPLYALYRLYDYLVEDHVMGYRNQLEYFLLVSLGTAVTAYEINH